MEYEVKEALLPWAVDEVLKVPPRGDDDEEGESDLMWVGCRTPVSTVVLKRVERSELVQKESSRPRG